MGQLTNEEKLIEFLNSELPSSNSNEVRINKRDVETLGFNEKQAAQLLHLIQTDGLIKIKFKPNSGDFKVFWRIDLTSKCVHYFDNKHDKNTIKRREQIKTYVPIIISTIALIFSGISLFCK